MSVRQPIPRRRVAGLTLLALWPAAAAAQVILVPVVPTTTMYQVDPYARMLSATLPPVTVARYVPTPPAASPTRVMERYYLPGQTPGPQQLPQATRYPKGTVVVREYFYGDGADAPAMGSVPVEPPAGAGDPPTSDRPRNSTGDGFGAVPVEQPAAEQPDDASGAAAPADDPAATPEGDAAPAERPDALVPPNPPPNGNAPAGTADPAATDGIQQSGNEEPPSEPATDDTPSAEYVPPAPTLPMGTVTGRWTGPALGDRKVILVDGASVVPAMALPIDAAGLLPPVQVPVGGYKVMLADADGTRRFLSFVRVTTDGPNEWQLAPDSDT